MIKLLSSMVLAVGLLVVPSASFAQDHHDQMQKHEWNDSEKDAWQRYLKEHHKKDHNWEKASKRERADYWKWRDAHPDQH